MSATMRGCVCDTVAYPVDKDMAGKKYESNWKTYRHTTRRYFFNTAFLPGGAGENLKDYSKFNFDPALLYAFGRLIEAGASGGNLVEIFNYAGEIPEDSAPVTNTGWLLKPLHVSMGFAKKRWRLVFEDDSYDPVIDSHYNDITFLLGNEDNPVLWKGGK